MCGRFALYTDPIALAKQFQTENIFEVQPSYNVAPSQTIPIVRNEQGHRLFALARWGLIPSWAKEINTGYNTINARAETVSEKPSFRNAFKHRRCLIPCDGYYEWQELAGQKTKQPWYITLLSQEPMALAGLWEHWLGSDGSEVESCTIIVTAGNVKGCQTPAHRICQHLAMPTSVGRCLTTLNKNRPSPVFNYMAGHSITRHSNYLCFGILCCGFCEMPPSSSRRFSYLKLNPKAI